MSASGALRVFVAKLQALFSQGKGNREFDDELQAHLQMLTERYLRQGLLPEQARQAAHRQFGNSSLLEERIREARSFLSLSAGWRDVQFGARQLARNPLFTAIAVSSLALGIRCRSINLPSAQP